MNRLLFALFLIASSFKIVAQQTIAEEGAWCWFADPRALHYENATGRINSSYLGYIDVHGNIKATQMDFLSGYKTDVLVRSYFQPDDHNNPTFLVLPDERVLIIYSRHTDEPAFYYRVSQFPGDITTLGPEKKIVTQNNTTYPSPFILSDDPDHFYLCWRGIGWHPTIARITLPDENDDVTVDWGPYQMVQSTGSRPYAKYASNGKDKIYVTYTTGHPDNENPNWLYFNVININATQNATTGKVSVRPTLNDIQGRELSVIENGKFNVSKTSSYQASYPMTIVDAPASVRDWVWQIVLDKQERPRIAMVKINGAKTQHQYYYARWTGTAWALTDVCDGGAKFHPSNTEYCYSGGMSLDPANPGDIYLSKPTQGLHGNVFEIWKYSVDDNGKVVSSEQLTKDSEKNNVRPFLLPGSENSPLRLAWMYGDYYYWMVNKNYPKGYPTSMRWNYQYVPYAIGNPEEPTYRSFHIQANVVLDANNYQGMLLQTDYFVYALDNDTQTPYLELNGQRYFSTNRLLSSDAWANNSSGTSGDYWPTKLTNVNLCISVYGRSVSIYRDGFLDQYIILPEPFEWNKEIADITASKGGKQPGSIPVQNYRATSNEVWTGIHKAALQEISLPTKVHTDLVLPSTLNATSIQWTSSHPEIISPNGIFHAPETATEVTLVATAGASSRSFLLQALPRNLDNALRALYTFDAKDIFTFNAQRYVRSHTFQAMDLAVMGNAVVDGTLNLTSNTASAFNSNGYGVIAPAILDSVRSYTILVDITAKSLTGAPRIYDMGVNAGNSLFLRANTLSAGIKYAGGTTTMTNSEKQLTSNQAYKLAVTYNAATQLTTLYVDGQMVASGKENLREPYELTLMGECLRNYIGRTQWWDNSSVASSNVDFVGTIDNLHFYDIALTQKEIQKKQGFTPEGEAELTLLPQGIKNPGFEASYQPMSPSLVSTDRAIQWPEAWTITHTAANENDLSIITDADAQSAFFATIPPYEGNAAYRIRQKWGASTIALSQAIDILPAGAYLLRAQVWQSGLGGQARIAATNIDGSAVTLSPTANAETWQTVDVPFLLDGQQVSTLTLSAIHNSNGSEKFLGFDFLQLYDRTASATSTELITLLEALLQQSKTFLQKTPNDALQTITEETSESLKNNQEQSVLLDLFLNLRNALDEARKTATRIENLHAAQLQDKIYEVNGQRAQKKRSIKIMGKNKVIQ